MKRDREEVMKARRLIEGSLYEPDILKVMFQAFDEAWTEIAHHFGSDPKTVEEARVRLAHACLIVAREDSNDAERIKRDALQVMALAYRERV
jgi:hypothetical protein